MIYITHYFLIYLGKRRLRMPHLVLHYILIRTHTYTALCIYAIFCRCSIFVVIKTCGIRFKESRGAARLLIGRDHAIFARDTSTHREFIVMHELIYQGGPDLSVCPRHGPEWRSTRFRNRLANFTRATFRKNGIASAAMHSVCNTRWIRTLYVNLYFNRI